MNDLCLDIGTGSLNKTGEQLCGDQVEVVSQTDGTSIVVLADGLGSGVKACILATLTARIIATMMAADMPVEDCVATIAAALPVSSEHGVAYSTFTIIRITDSQEAEIIQYDNPAVILLRDGCNCEIPVTTITIGDKTISRAKIALRENDIFIALSDGAVHAGTGLALNMHWQREDIINYMAAFSQAGYTAKSLTTLLLDECNSLYDGCPGDDTTVCTVRIRRREPLNLLLGPPASRDDNSKMMALFFAKAGKHIVCGGTTAALAAAYLNQKVIPRNEVVDPEVPPMSDIKGIDLVSEGILTLNKVLRYALDYIQDNETFRQWCFKRDAASQIARLLFEEATDINFYVGRAVNPAHQDPSLPINFSSKMRLVEELTRCLDKMGKRIKVSYF